MKCRNIRAKYTKSLNISFLEKSLTFKWIMSIKIVENRKIHIFKLEKGDAEMRIDAYNQVSQLYQASKLNKANKAYGNVTPQANQDQVQISTTGRDYQTAKRAVAGAPEIREAKVAQLKEQMNANTYHVDDEDFAAKLLDKYSGLL